MDLKRQKVRPGVNLVHVEGSMDLYSVPELKEFIAEDPSPHVIFDLTRCDFIDSSGLGTLIYLKTHANPPCESIALIHVSPRIKHLLELTNTILQFPVFASLEAAMAELPR